MTAPLLDIAAASEARDAAISRVRAAASPAFLIAATRIVVELARTRDQITTDDVWVELATIGQTTAEPRALGAVMREMRAERFIEPTNAYVPSARVACHRRPVRVWRSLVRC
jgi:hypothetical protein